MNTTQYKIENLDDRSLYAAPDFILCSRPGSGGFGQCYISPEMYQWLRAEPLSGFDGANPSAAAFLEVLQRGRCIYDFEGASDAGGINLMSSHSFSPSLVWRIDGPVVWFRQFTSGEGDYGQCRAFGRNFPGVVRGSGSWDAFDGRAIDDHLDGISYADAPPAVADAHLAVGEAGISDRAMLTYARFLACASRQRVNGRGTVLADTSQDLTVVPACIGDAPPGVHPLHGLARRRVGSYHLIYIGHT